MKLRKYTSQSILPNFPSFKYVQKQSSFKTSKYLKQALYCFYTSSKIKYIFKQDFFFSNQGISSHKKGTKYNNNFTTTHCKGSNMILELVRVRIQVNAFFSPHFWFSIRCFNLQIMKIQLKVSTNCLLYVHICKYLGIQKSLTNNFGTGCITLKQVKQMALRG